MLIMMKASATEAQVARVCEQIRAMGLVPHPIPGAGRTAIGITGNQGPLEPGPFSVMPGVADAVAVSKPYKLVSRELQPADTVVTLPSGVRIGGGTLTIMAGPCAVENRDQVLRTAEVVAKSGAQLLRGGAYKPRTSPYAFQGLKEEGLKILAEARAQTGLPIVTEVKDTDTLPTVEAYADVLQVGARNMQNFSLLEAVGRSRKPVLLKRGMSATIQEWLLAAEYIMSQGNYQVILCERGIRTYENATRNTLDISAVPVLRQITHLPVITDPSHAIGLRYGVAPLAKASVAVGADGVMVEVHPAPEKALSDGPQALTFEDYETMMREVRALADVLGRPLGPQASKI
ncbi:MAG: 3-deoxy-7-phosphoheptulonate synthase [Myxococcota bacterium]